MRTSPRSNDDEARDAAIFEGARDADLARRRARLADFEIVVPT